MISLDGKAKLAKTRMDPGKSISAQRTRWADSFMILIACDNRMHVRGPSTIVSLGAGFPSRFYGPR